MCPVVFRIFGIPVYGFGIMLFLAFVVCTWLASRRAQKEGIAPGLIQDLAIWVFIGGIVGARIVYMIQYRQPLDQFFKIWEGGLVYYGSALGGLAGYGLAYLFLVRKHSISMWKMADIIAPVAALGLCLGRIGCFLNGCCYGNVACSDCPHVHFPLSAPARYALVEAGHQSAAGFTMADKENPPTVDRVEPGSPALASGLQPGDAIVEVDGRQIGSYTDVLRYLLREWPRGKTDLTLTVRRSGQDDLVHLPPFRPVTLGPHPTQIYESISTALLFFLLSAYYPLRRHDGEVMVLFMIGYSVHRFLNEMLRNDTDAVALGMTLSQNVSIVVFVAGLASAS